MSPHAAAACLALLALAPAPAPGLASADSWDIRRFLDEQSTDAIDYFQRQKEKVEGVFASGYRDAVRLKQSVDEYVEGKQREIADEVSGFVEQRARAFATPPAEARAPRDDERLREPDAALSVPGVLRRHGYPCETHALRSRGHVLAAHRVPRAAPARAVLLHHGLFASSADWLLSGPGKALAFVLYDAGYDVWLANMRGNRYSREHTDLRTDSEAYWDFSWHEAAVHDVPALIDYVRGLKGGAKVAYVGHSMGSTILFAMLAARPEYNGALAGAVALAPVAYTAGVRGPLRALAPLASNAAYMEMMYGRHEFVPKASALGGLAGACRGGGAQAAACKDVIFSLCGANEKQFNASLLPAFLAHLGTGTSWKTVVHFAQEIQAGGRFQMFDYGPAGNARLYGTSAPPEYDLGRISVPVTLFWSRNDPLSSEADVRALAARLPAGSAARAVPDAAFSHLDYLWAVDAPRLVNEPLLDCLRDAFRKDDSWLLRIW